MSKKLITIGLVGLLGMPLSVCGQQTFDLRQCIDYAIAHNITVKQREIAKEESEVEVNTAQWSRIPSVNASASHAFNFGRSLQRDNTYQSVNSQNTSGSLSAAMPLFTGFQIPNQIALSKLNLLAAVADLQKAKEDIAIAVTSSYLQVMYNHELCKVSTDQVALSQEQLTRKEAFYEVGKASEAEVLEAKARIAQDELGLVQANNNYRLALLDLSQLLELASPDSLQIVFPDLKAESYFGEMSSPAAIYNEAVLSKPAVQAARLRLEGAGKSVQLAKSGYYPQLSLGAGLGTNFYQISGIPNTSFKSQIRDNFSQYIGLQLNIPIFDRFATRNRIRTARLQQQSLSWQLEETKKNLFKEIQQAYYNAVGAESKYKTSVEADKAAQAAFELMKAKYEEGTANATQFNEARTNWLKATYDASQAKYDFVFRMKILDFYKGIAITL